PGIRRARCSSTSLPLDDANRLHPRHLLAQPSAMNDIDDVIDVLVRVRLLFREATAALRPRDDATRLQLLVDASAAGVLDRGSSAHLSPGAVAGRAERLLHAARLADQDPARSAHVARDDYRLADLLIHRRHLRVLRRKRPRRALAVHPQLLPLAADL